MACRGDVEAQSRLTRLYSAGTGGQASIGVEVEDVQKNWTCDAGGGGCDGVCGATEADAAVQFGIGFGAPGYAYPVAPAYPYPYYGYPAYGYGYPGVGIGFGWGGGWGGHWGGHGFHHGHR